MKLWLISLAVVLSLSGAALAPAEDAGDVCQGLDRKVAALAGEYRELRERRRLLPEGVDDKDLRHHGGKLHNVLSALGVALGRPPQTKRRIVSCLGEPDAVKNDEQMGPYLDIYRRELRKTGRELAEKSGREYLIYQWRGGHDFLFFISEDGNIVDHGWWFAYE